MNTMLRIIWATARLLSISIAFVVVIFSWRMWPLLLAFSTYLALDAVADWLAAEYSVGAKGWFFGAAKKAEGWDDTLDRTLRSID